jgi:hypothetical protein
VLVSRATIASSSSRPTAVQRRHSPALPDCDCRGNAGAIHQCCVCSTGCATRLSLGLHRGVYQGQSDIIQAFAVPGSGSVEREPRYEEFTIRQDLFEIRIDGSSYVQQGTKRVIYSQWTGTAFRKDGSQIWFALTLVTDVYEEGVLRLTIGRGQFAGTCASTRPTSGAPSRIAGHRVGGAQRASMIGHGERDGNTEGTASDPSAP